MHEALTAPPEINKDVDKKGYFQEVRKKKKVKKISAPARFKY